MRVPLSSFSQNHLDTFCAFHETSKDFLDTSEPFDVLDFAQFVRDRSIDSVLCASQLGEL